jgi:drug/metabolite transporter (DMT)-like permease
MEKAIPLALAASLCTATASVCQRFGARSSEAEGFDIWLVFRLARRPIWLLGIASMILGFVFQVTALRFGPLALVQPILALELLFVFAYMTIGSRRLVKVKRRDWLAAVAMSVGMGLFLGISSPSGGRLHAPGPLWWLAGIIFFGIVLLALAVAFGHGRRPGASPSRRAAVLGAATGISWGFVAAVIKEFSSHLGDGIGAVVSSWSLYVLIVVGAGTLLLASHALAAGPLAASQPGFTILDPLSASLLGLFLFGEHMRAGVMDLAAEGLALAVLVAGVSALSHSHLIVGEDGPIAGEDGPIAGEDGPPYARSARYPARGRGERSCQELQLLRPSRRAGAMGSGLPLRRDVNVELLPVGRFDRVLSGRRELVGDRLKVIGVLAVGVVDLVEFPDHPDEVGLAPEQLPGDDTGGLGERRDP